MKMTQKRQTADENACFVGNDQLSCFPTAGTSIVQDQWGKFIWNRYYPEFTNSGGNVDIYLFHQDSDKVVEKWLNVPNTIGRISFSPVDTWWQDRIQADNFNGTNIDWPFYFVITAAGKGLKGPLDRQPTFNAVQTALPASVAAARISSSLAAAASSSSAAAAATATIPMNATKTMTSAPSTAPTALPTNDAALSSIFAASLTSALVSSLSAINATGTQSLHATATTTLPDGAMVTASATAIANGSLNIPKQNVGLPTYAIALIVVFGFLTLAGMIVLLYFCLKAARRREFRDHIHRDVDIVSGGDSSNTPFIEHASNESEQQMLEVAGAAEEEESSTPRRRSLRRYSDSSNLINANRQNEGLSANEVWRLANAFRSALRKPRFSNNTRTNSLAGIHEQREGAILGPEMEQQQQQQQQEADISVEDTTADLLLRDELAREGRSIRLVEDRKKPELHEG